MGLTRPRAYQIFDIDYKQSVRVVTVSNVTLGGGAPSQVDGVSLSLNDRVLVTAQSTGSQNGLYYVTTVGTGSNGTWARSVDGNETGEIDAGMIVMVTEGTTYADTQWKLTTNDPIVIGSTALTFVQNYSANSISAGTSNVTVTSNANVSIAVAGSNVAVFTSGGPHQFTGNLNPTSNITYSLGNASSRWKDIYLANSSIYLGNVTLSADATQLLVNGSNVVTSTGGAMTLTGNITGGNLITSGLVSATGNIDTTSAININSSSGMYNVLNITGTALAPYGSSQTWKFFTQNAVPGGPGSWILFPDSSTQTTAYPGSSSALTLTGNITGGNLITTGIANIGTLAVTGAGTIGTTLGVTGNITGGNLVTAGLISATGNITGGNIIANGRSLTSLTASNIDTGTLAQARLANASIVIGNTTATLGATVTTITGLTSVTSTTFVGALTGAATTAGTVTTAAQPNITSVGTLSSLTVSGNVTGGNLITAGVANVTGTITTAAGTNSTGFAVGNGAVSNVGLGFFPTAGTRGDYAIRDYSSVFSTMYLDVGMGGSAGGEFQFRSSNAYNLVMRANTTGVYSSGVVSATGIVYGSELNSTNSGVNEGGQINLALPSSGSTLSTSVIIDVYQNKVRFFEGGGTARGAYIDLTSCSAGAATNLLAGAGGTPGGSNTYVQFNDAGSFGGNGQFVYDKVTNTLTAGIIAANNNGAGTNFKVGDDAWIGDINAADTMRVMGQQNAANAYIVFGNADGVALGRAGSGALTYGGAFTATGNITGGNLSGTSIVGTLTTAAQTNITSVGTLGSLAVTANITGGNANISGRILVGSGNASAPGITFSADTGQDTGFYWISDGSIGISTNGTLRVTIDGAGNVTATGNISGGNIIANGRPLTSLNATNIDTGTLAQARLANASIVIGNTTATLGATVTTITGLTSVTSTTFVGALTGAATSATTAGTVTTAAQPNITSVGTLSSLTVSANITAGNLTGATLVSATNLTGTLTTSAQPNITSVGTLSSLAVSGAGTIGTTLGVTGNITGGNLITAGLLSVNSGNVTGTVIVNAGANGVGNIGSATGYFNTAHVKATSAQYADLAEMYVADADYAPGTVVEFGGEYEVTQTVSSCSTAIAGIISTNPSYLMNSCQPGEHVLPVALTGRVPCRVLGPVKKGDVLISSGIPGIAQRIGTDWQPGCTVGKAMENILESEVKTIEVAVGRL